VRMARVKLQHDLFDRRYRVFDATRILLANICAKGNASEEDQRAFVLGTGEAAFLFNDDLTRYLEEMGRRVVVLQNCRHMLETLPVGVERTKVVDVMTDHRMWFHVELSSLVSKFEPFLKLDKRQQGVRRAAAEAAQFFRNLWRVLRS
jgi:hypothetical protein